MKNLNKKLIRDYIYFTDTLEDIKHISGEAEGKFRSAMQSHNEKAMEALNPPIDSTNPEPIKREEPVKFEDKDFKKLFRKIAIKCHPDKLDGSHSESETEFLKECYGDINDANSMYDWGLLLKTAIELSIELPELTIEQVNNISNNIKSIKDDIMKYEGSMAYQWYTLHDSVAKRGYLESCAQIFMSSLHKD